MNNLIIFVGGICTGFIIIVIATTIFAVWYSRREEEEERKRSQAIDYVDRQDWNNK